MFEPIKNGFHFSRDAVGFLSEAQRRHGDYHLARFGTRRVHLIFDPELARTVLGDPLTFRKTKFVYDKIKPITGPGGLVQIEGEPGLKLRQAFNRHFNRDSISAYLATARVIVEHRIQDFEGEHDIRGTATELVLETALAMFAGVTSNGSSATGLSEQFLRLNELCAREFKNLLPTGNPLRRWQIRRTQRRLDRAIEEVVQANSDPNSLISTLRAGASDIPAEVSSQFLRDQVKTFLFAGHETTATYLIMALDELAKDGRLQHLVREDLLEHPDGGGEIATAFLREVLRLHSPAWMIVRESTGDGEAGGYPYRQGDYFFIGVHQIHHHPDHWGSPDRLDLANQAQKNIAFLPYGAGKRHCIGSRLADLELKMILGILLGRYQLTHAGDYSTVRPKVMITAYPDEPVQIRFSNR